MSIFDWLRDTQIAYRKSDEAYFASALQEFQSGKIRPGLMGKAISESHGDKNKANAIYLKLLTEAIKDDDYIEQRSHEKRQESLARAKARIDGMNASKNKPSHEEVSFFRKLFDAVVNIVGAIFIFLILVWIFD